MSKPSPDYKSPFQNDENARQVHSRPMTPYDFYRKVLVWVISLVLIFGSLATFFGRPIYDIIKYWRAEHFAEQAQIAFEKKDIQLFFKEAQAALQLNRSHPQMLRMVAQIYTIHSNENAFIYWRQLFDTPNAVADDYKQCVALAVRLRRFDIAQQRAPQMLKLAPEDDEAYLLAAESALLRGDAVTGLELVRNTLTRSPQNKVARFFLAQILSQHGKPDEKDEGREMLKKVCLDGEAIGLRAAEFMSTLPDLSSDQTLFLKRRLLSHPLKEYRHSLLAYDMEWRLDASLNKTQVEAVLAEQSKLNPQQRLELAKWLNRRKEFAATVGVVSMEEAIRNGELFLLRIDALAGLGRWDDARRILEDDFLPIDPILAELYRARVATVLDDKTAQEIHWRKIKRLTVGNVTQMRFVADYAEKMGALDRAISFYEDLAQASLIDMYGNRKLISLYEQTANTLKLRKTLQRMLEVMKNDPVIQNDIAYVNLLLKEEIDFSEKLAHVLVKQHPDVPAFRVTLMFALYRKYRFSEAFEVWQSLNVPKENMLPGWRAVAVAVLESVGKKAEAREIVKDIPVARLKHEERLLIQSDRQF